ncbi:hypothetical protein GLOIN_2v1774345 [Rhizophagus irregularis DAOM 181602=DAOM 197198]|nr:hypothetical protein GLOIN_2v1774345 [Rhizophagus irregularis DAOM 181602=DAOM 197198]
MSRNIHFTCFDNTMELVLQNPHFTYNIKNFTLRIFHAPNVTNIISFLKFLCSNCNLITSLHFSLSSINDFSAIRKYLSQMIISQHNLKIVSFGTSIDILYHLFLSLKNSNCSNTLNTIIFDSIDFRNVITVLQEVFDQLNVLESIHILYCDSLNSDFVQQIIKVIKPFKLRSLCIKDILYIESLQLLLQKCGDYLENFEFGSECEEYEGSRQQFLELIMKYCTKIKRFTTENPDDINIYLLIENIGQTINCLTIDIYYDDLDSNEYIMRKERVKYLAFSECFPYDDTARELFSLEDEVNEFRLHNVIVQRYDDLCISIHGIIYDLNV